ncbi:MAG: ABC transporter ATP-binding protein [Pseudomonadota bacterium]|nr:ABC transporter ATP-binding protein [Pseudomonadota bacterium]
MSSEQAAADPIIRVRDLSKCYHIYRRPVDRVLEMLLPGKQSRHAEFWALKNIGFEINRGETVGIIGRNGSGKSTLLEIICDTLNPTTGEVSVGGRVAALLELGAGFNPEFTGRENVMMNAAIMGIPESRIKEKFDEVVEFAEIGDHIEQPVKTYSSGMYVRLAFATAIHMEPEILVVDEALAVGDIRFQRKCFRVFENLKQQNKTILFVTHSVELVRTYCDRAIFLEQGEMQNIGDPREVVYDYLDLLFGSQGEGRPQVVAAPAGGNGNEPAVFNLDPAIDGCAARRTYNPMEYRWGDARAKIIDYVVECDGKIDPAVCEQGQTMTVRMLVAFQEALDGLIYGLTVKTVDGVTVYGANTRNRDFETQPHQAGERVEICFRFQLNLVQGNYFVSLGVALDDNTVDNLAIDRRYDLFTLAVHGDRADFGIADLVLEFDELKR